MYDSQDEINVRHSAGSSSSSLNSRLNNNNTTLNLIDEYIYQSERLEADRFHDSMDHFNNSEGSNSLIDHFDRSNKTSRTDQQNGVISDELCLNLKWGLRDLIVSTISRYSSIICGKMINVEEKKFMSKVHCDLIQKLSMLSFDNNEHKFESNLTLVEECLLNVLEEEESDVYLNLNWEQRDRIICNLVKNYSLIILYADCVSTSVKNVLLNENTQTIRLLLDLQVKSADDSGFEEDNSTLNNHELNRGNREIVFEFEIDKVKRHLLRNKRIDSETFYCSSMPWCIMVKSKVVDEEDGTKYFGIFLESKNDSNDISWRIEIEFELRIVSQSSDVLDRVRTHKITFTDEKRGFGWVRFIKHEDLDKYIKNDSLKLQAHVKADKVFKCENLSQES